MEIDLFNYEGVERNTGQDQCNLLPSIFHIGAAVAVWRLDLEYLQCDLKVRQLQCRSLGVFNDCDTRASKGKE